MRRQIEGAVFRTPARSLPFAVGPGDALGALVGEGLHAHLCVGNLCGFFENGSHARVGREGLAFLDAERGEFA